MQADTALIAPATLTDLSIAEKEQRIRDMLIQEGRDARETGENVNWRIGRAAVKYVETFAADNEGKVDDGKKKPCLKEYAVSIGMYDNTHRIYELHSVAEFWNEGAQAHFKDVSWSRFRECSRHGLTLSQASTILHQHGEAPVAKLRKIILETHGTPASARPVRAVFDVHFVSHWSSDGPRCVMDAMSQERLHDTIAQHAGAKVTIVVEYTPAGARAEPSA